MSRKNKIFRAIFCVVIVITFFLSTFVKVWAANAYLSPSSGTYHVGDTIKVRIMASSDKSMNAMSVKVSFSRNTLKLSSVSKSSSLISLWPREAVYSNNDGFASFEGVVLSGYTGSSGNMITLIFEAKAEGKASVWFDNVSILANDGDGTNIFSGGLNRADFNIGKAEKTPIVETKISSCPDISPDESKISCVALNVGEKINEVESDNNLPTNSLLVTIAVAFIIVLALLTIYLLVLIFKLKRYFKEKLSKAEVIISEDFKNLKSDLTPKDSPAMTSESAKILGEVANTEENIIKEVENIENES